MGKTLQGWCCAGVVAGLLLMPKMSAADYLKDVGQGTATVAANIVYIPTKLVYATLGGITGGFAYVLTGANRQTAEKVWTPSLGGNYVISRDQLWGNEVLYFSGTVPPKTQPPGSVALHTPAASGYPR